MKDEPSLAELLHHLSECPAEFVEAGQNTTGQAVAAIICDLFRPILNVDSTPFVSALLVSQARKSKLTIRHHSLLAVCCWLLHHEAIQRCLLKNASLKELAWDWMQNESLVKLSKLVSTELFVTDPDRREELVRVCLAALGLKPLGETDAQAEDRRTTLDSIERQRVLEATAAAERRAREVREAMARKQALESASRYGE